MNLLDSSLSAVADPTRRAILGHLRGGSATVSAVVEQFDLTQPTISSHLKILERAGLISRRSEEHTSELQSLMRSSYAVFCLKKKNNTIHISLLNPLINNELQLMPAQ